MVTACNNNDKLNKDYDNSANSPIVNNKNENNVETIAPPVEEDVYDYTDTEGPIISIVVITPNQTKLGGKVTVEAKITDINGVKNVDVQLCNGVGNVAGGQLTLVEGNKKTGTYKETFTLPKDTTAGGWGANIYANAIYNNTGLSWGDSNEKFSVIK